MIVRKVGNYYVVEGKITTHPRKIGNEDYSRVFRKRSEAEADAVRWMRIEKELITYRTGARRVREITARTYLEKRAARPKQLALPF